MSGVDQSFYMNMQAMYGKTGGGKAIEVGLRRICRRFSDTYNEDLGRRRTLIEPEFA